MTTTRCSNSVRDRRTMLLPHRYWLQIVGYRRLLVAAAVAAARDKHTIIPIVPAAVSVLLMVIVVVHVVVCIPQYTPTQVNEIAANVSSLCTLSDPLQWKYERFCFGYFCIAIQKNNYVTVNVIDSLTRITFL